MTKIIQVVNWLALAFAAAIVLASITFAYVLLSPIDVLESWQISVDDKQYHPGEELTLHARYTKVRDITGVTYYYLECMNTSGRLVRYPMSQAEGNRPKGKGEADVPLKIPAEIPDPPFKCRIAVSVDYTIYSFRKVTENTESNYFIVKEKE